jgi:hypothetical protein
MHIGWGRMGGVPVICRLFKCGPMSPRATHAYSGTNVLLEQVPGSLCKLWGSDIIACRGKPYVLYGFMLEASPSGFGLRNRTTKGIN